VVISAICIECSYAVLAQFNVFNNSCPCARFRVSICNPQNPMFCEGFQKISQEYFNSYQDYRGVFPS
jgi:hypothetical protein